MGHVFLNSAKDLSSLDHDALTGISIGGGSSQVSSGAQTGLPVQGGGKPYGNVTTPAKAGEVVRRDSRPVQISQQSFDQTNLQRMNDGRMPMTAQDAPDATRKQALEAARASNDAQWLYNIAQSQQRQGETAQQRQEGVNLAINNSMYDLAERGNAVAAGRVQDTDALMAQSRGDAPGTEYARNNEPVNGGPSFQNFAFAGEKGTPVLPSAGPNVPQMAPAKGKLRNTP